jgi:uncharacterized protein
LRAFFLDKEGTIFILGAFHHVKAGGNLLTIQIEKIKSKELCRSGELETASLPGLDELVLNGQLIVNGPVAYSFKLSRIGEMITIQGHVKAQVVLACGRCLENFELPVQSDFDLVYALQMPEVEDESDEELELTADDLGIVLLTGDEIDLAEPLVEQLLLSLPFKSVCRKDCKGLCPHCGVDLNYSECQCDVPQFDTRFSALKNLKIDSDK